ncbi:MAG: hypothetical protein CM15mP120_00710 [Pseudomonadota bacterium]|nr:MAG: hypothetical protein CM15mP120_00710 [Pseudomonadota bacterium]
MTQVSSKDPLHPPRAETIAVVGAGVAGCSPALRCLARALTSPCLSATPHHPRAMPTKRAAHGNGAGSAVPTPSPFLGLMCSVLEQHYLTC